jgi:hypothetical protein
VGPYLGSRFKPDPEVPGMMVGDPEGSWIHYEESEQVRRQERSACADLTRVAGCLCRELVRGGQAVFRASGHYQSVVQIHDPRCPAAILAAIEARGRA